VVLVKFFVNMNQAQRLEEVGVPRVAVDHVRQEIQHREVAQAAGKDPYALRSHRADAGVQVFGKEGLKAMRADEARISLEAEGFKVVDTHVLENADGKDVCVIIFAKGELVEKETSLPPKAKERLDFLWNSSWKFAHVWANPRGKDGYLVQSLQDKVRVPEQGLVVHTVNCMGRQDGLPLCNPKFVNGVWKA
jgi:hypothetical protein